MTLLSYISIQGNSRLCVTLHSPLFHWKHFYRLTNVWLVTLGRSCSRFTCWYHERELNSCSTCWLFSSLTYLNASLLLPQPGKKTCNFLFSESSHCFTFLLYSDSPRTWIFSSRIHSVNTRLKTDRDRDHSPGNLTLIYLLIFFAVLELGTRHLPFDLIRDSQTIYICGAWAGSKRIPTTTEASACTCVGWHTH